MNYTILPGDCIESMRTLPEKSVNCCITSPPYYGLRDYGHEGQIGLEETPDQYVAKMVEVFREVRRVLRDDGTVWLNLGDSYAGGGGGNYNKSGISQAGGQHITNVRNKDSWLTNVGLKPKDLIGIPWRVAFALQADGWWLRQDIIWCLSGGTWLYARTRKGDMPIMVRDLARLNHGTVQLWNGEKWTSLLGMSKSKRHGDELEIVLRSGERISCTPTHRFPTQRGLLDAGELQIGDILDSCRLPESDDVKDCSIDCDAAWFAGLFIAEGSRAGDTIQISGHSKESERWERVQRVAAKFGGTATKTIDGNNMAIRVYGKILNAIIYELTTGRTAKNKGFASVVWRYSNQFIEAIVDGYLSGDGHKDGNRWRLGFTRNYNLERDLRTACARLGYTLTLNLASVEYGGRHVPTFKGELRKERSGHHNERDRNEVVKISKARCREVYDLGVADEPHLFALASGVLTHNSKPNPMPESVTDRCTKSHEYIFLLTKSARYWYDAEAIKEAAKQDWGARDRTNGKYHKDGTGLKPHSGLEKNYETVNRRSVWTVATQPYKGAHFATFPPDLIRPCVQAGCPAGGTVIDPFGGSGTTGQVAIEEGRNTILCELNPAYIELMERRLSGTQMPLF